MNQNIFNFKSRMALITQLLEVIAVVSVEILQDFHRT